MLTADTSVVVPSLLDWHEHHEIARPALVDVRRLPAHVLAESFSVLTRLPHGLSLPASTASEVLLDAFPGEALTLDGRAAGVYRAVGVRFRSPGTQS